MKFRNRDDTLDLGRAWRLDCRLTSELPEDNVVRARFLANAIFGAIALGAALVTLLFGYRNAALSGTIKDWERNLADNKAEIEELRQLERDISTLSRRIDAAHQLAGAPFLVSEFVLHLGRTRPPQVQLDLIELTPAGVSLRGSLTEATSERASRLLSRYVESLRTDAGIGPLFGEIKLTGFDRKEDTGNQLSFEISFAPR